MMLVINGYLFDSSNYLFGCFVCISKKQVHSHNLMKCTRWFAPALFLHNSALWRWKSSLAGTLLSVCNIYELAVNVLTPFSPIRPLELSLTRWNQCRRCFTPVFSEICLCRSNIWLHVAWLANSRSHNTEPLQSPV